MSWPPTRAGRHLLWPCILLRWGAISLGEGSPRRTARSECRRAPAPARHGLMDPTSTRGRMTVDRGPRCARERSKLFTFRHRHVRSKPARRRQALARRARPKCSTSCLNPRRASVRRSASDARQRMQRRCGHDSSSMRAPSPGAGAAGSCRGIGGRRRRGRADDSPSATGIGANMASKTYALKNPGGYCGLGGTGVSCPVGPAVPQTAQAEQ